MADNWSTEKSIMARKAHTCDGCHGTIETGHTYHKDVGCYEGNFFAIKMHHECRLLWQDIWTETKECGDDMYPFIPEELSEMDDGDPFIDRYNKIAEQYGGTVFDPAQRHR
jgi:hypothetical protein